MLGVPLLSPSTATPDWTNVTYYVPSDTTVSHQTGFVDTVSGTADSTMVTTGFVFYGSIATLEQSNGQLETMWYALPYGDTGLYTLNWNPTGDSTSGKILITLKSTQPSVPPGPPPGSKE
jgi:hypothetical protein